MPARERQNSDRARRIQQIVDECIARQVSGQLVSHEALIAASPDLMPELGEALRKLALIDRASRKAHDANNAD